MKILIVDDSSAMRMIIERHLRAIGYGAETLMHAADGAAALRLARQTRPDLVLADWNMPQMTGLELFRALQLEKLPTKVGFITSEVSDDSRRAVVDEGALFVLAKPFTQADLQQALAETLPASPVGLPEPEAIGELLSKLFDRRVSAKRGMPVVFGQEGKVLVGIYERGEAPLVGAIAVDALLSAAFSAAIALGPPVAAARKGELSPEVLDNAREVLNVCARLFSTQSDPVVKLRTVRSHPPALPTDVAVLAAQPASRLDVQVEILGYGSGSMSLFTR